MARTYYGGAGSALNFWICVAASTVLVFYGYDQGVFGNVIVGNDFLETMGNPDATAQGNLVSTYNLGCFAGAVATIWLGDILGRPNTLIVGSSIVVVGAILQCSAFGVAQLYAGRVIAGLGTGMNTSTAGVWQAETSNMTSRGKMIAIQMTVCAFGLMLSNWLTLGFSYCSGSIAWRFPLAFQVVFAIIIFLLCPKLPDSPRLLIRKGRFEEAREVLAALEGQSSDSPEIVLQFKIIKDVLDREHLGDYTWRQLLSGQGPAGVIRRMILGAGMQAMNQLCGVNIIAYYATYVFIHSLGFSTIRSATSHRALRRFCGCFHHLDLLDRAFWPSQVDAHVSTGDSAELGCHCYNHRSLFPVSPCQRVVGHRVDNFFYVFFAFFGIGFDPVTWVYPSEINALEARAKGASVAMATNWILNYMIAEITPRGVQSLEWRFWIIWAVITTAFLPVIYLFYPETANRSLEDVDRFFETNHNLFIHNNKMATGLARPETFALEDNNLASSESSKAPNTDDIEMVERV